MALFTFVMDYRGGTYLSQVEARNKETAMRLWLEQLEVGFHADFTNDVKMALIKEDFEFYNVPTPITGLKNTWGFVLRINKLAGIHFVKTCE